VGLPDAMSVLSRWALGDERSNRADVGLIRLSVGFVEPFVVEVSIPPRRYRSITSSTSRARIDFLHGHANTCYTSKHPLHFPLEHKHTHRTIGRENLLKSRWFFPYMPSAPLVRVFSSADTETLLAARTFPNVLESRRF
jgi:hypothetical protein